MANSQIRRTIGATTAEFAAALVFLIPLAIGLLLVAAEVTQAYMINGVLAQCAEKAARELSIQYSNDTSIVNSRALQDSLVYDTIRSNGTLEASEQFDDAVWVTDPLSTKTVTVNVRYTSGQNGLAPFPFIDPLHLAASFQLAGKASYRLD
jgi:hypothetical protein